MSLPFDAVSQSGRNVAARIAGATGTLADGLSDGAAGVFVVARNLTRAFLRAHSETKLALGFGAMLAVLACLPEYSATPRAEAAGTARAGLDATALTTPAYDRDPWRPVPAKLAVWRLEAPQLAGAGMINRLRALPDGSRQDLLVWSPGRGNRFSGAVSLEHYLGEAPDADSLYVETVRRAALSGASVERMAQAVSLSTKFGAFESADAAVDAGQGPQQCIAFRHNAADVPIRISGWFCGADQPLDRGALSCLINRLDLVNSGDDAGVRGWFAASERNRSGCETGVPGSARWLEAGAKMPALKRDVTGAIPKAAARGG